MGRTLYTNIGELVTLAPLAAARPTRAVCTQASDLGLTTGPAWLSVVDGRVEGAGAGVPPAAAEATRVDLGGALVLPGFVDSHTHALFGGTRAAEFARRLAGATYQEIAAAGGGIRATVAATAACSDEELVTSLADRLAHMLRQGVTTVEVKSGYGLTIERELRLLRLIAAAQARTPQTVVATCLALHADSDEYPTRAAYAQHCATALLPVVAAEGLARWVDAFIEEGYYSASEVAPYATAARALGLGVRLHADEFSDAGAAAAAASWGAASADHLQHASAAGIAAMARAGVIATLLPGTSLYTRLPFTDARRFLAAGVPVAVASDFNPGSCRIDNLPLLAAAAAVQCGLAPHEALVAITWNAAAALGLATRKGALAPGYDADLVVYPGGGLADWLADFGGTAPEQVWIQGREVVSSPR